MLNLSLKELELKSKYSAIKDYKSLSIDKLLSILDKPERAKLTKTIKDERKENFNSDKILRDIRSLYESDQEDCYKPIRICSAFSSNYIEYESNGDKDKILSIKSGNTEIMICNEIDEIIKNLFESLLQKYQEGLEKSMKRSEFVFDSADLLYYKLHSTSLNRGGSYIDSPEWLKNKATINPKNNDDKCFQYAVTVALNLEQIKKDPQGITKIKPFIDQYNWKEIDFPSHKNDWNESEKNNKTSAPNILYVPRNTEKVRHAYKS